MAGRSGSRDIRIENINVTYSSNQVHACREVSLTVGRKAMHAIVGENGAGKSTIMKVLSGDIRPDSGTIWIDSNPVTFRHPEDAIERGIGMIHQIVHVFSEMTVREHLQLSLGSKNPLARLDDKRCDTLIQEACRRYELQLEPDQIVGTLSAESKAETTLLTLIARSCDLFIFDEPPKRLLGCARKLQAEGKQVVIITHSMADALSFCGQVTVMRSARVVGTYETETLTVRGLSALVMGEEPMHKRREQTLGSASRNNPIMIDIRRLTGGRKGTSDYVRDISLQVHAGETVAVVGIKDNGLRALEALSVCGRSDTYRRDSGSVLFDGRQISECDPSIVGYIPSDRLEIGAAAGMSVMENLLMSHRRVRELFLFPRLGLYDSRKRRSLVERAIGMFSLKGNGSHRLESLSGGNIQKLITARALLAEPKVLVCSDISWGLDGRTRESLFEAIDELKARSMAVLLFTSEIEVALEEADRIAVIRKGELVELIENTRGLTASRLGESML